MSHSINTSTRYKELSEKLENIELSNKLLILSNLLFDCYQDTKRADLLYQQIDKPDIEVMENYAYMKELYNFEENSFVYILLDRAHDILRLSVELDKYKYGNKDERPHKSKRK